MTDNALSTRIIDTATARIVLNALARLGQFGYDSSDEPFQEWTPERSGATRVYGDYFTKLNPCDRCGGSGYGGWHQDGGICYKCKGEFTENRTSRVYFKEFARKQRISWRHREKSCARRREIQENTLAGQRKWCEENGYGSITFEERQAIQDAESKKKAPALAATALVLKKKYVGTVVAGIGRIRELREGEGLFGIWYLVKVVIDGLDIPVAWLTSSPKALRFPVDTCVTFKGRVKEISEFNSAFELRVSRATIKEVKSHV